MDVSSTLNPSSQNPKLFHPIPVEPEPEPELPEEGNFSLPKILGMVRRKWFLVLGLTIGLAFASGLKSYRVNTIYQSEFQIQVQPITQKQQLSGLTEKGTSGSGESSKEFDYSTQIEVLLSQEILKPILSSINKKYPSFTYDELMQNLVVQRLGETRIIEIQYKDEDSEKVTFVLEALAKGYLKYSYDEQRAVLRRGIDFVDKQLPDIKKKVDILQNKLQELRQQYNFVDPDSYAQDLYKKLSQVAQERQDLRVDLAALQVRYQNLQKQLGATVAANESGPYKEFLSQYQALDRQIAIELARFGENSPTIKLLRRQQANLVPLLEKEAQRAVKNQIATVANDIQVMKAREKTFLEAEAILGSRFKQMPLISRIFAELQRELKVSTESLDRFLSTRESLEIEAAQKQLPWYLIKPPKNPPYALPKSSFTKGILTGLIGGLVAGVVLGYILEMLEGALYTRGDLRKKTRLPILGMIPYWRSLNAADPELHILDWRSLTQRRDLHPARSDWNLDGPSHPEVVSNGAEQGPDEVDLDDPDQTLPIAVPGVYSFLEAFRALNAYLGRLLGNPSQYTLSVCSALPREGRTTVAFHLAQATAAMNRKVLLVDAHLRHGAESLNEMLGLPEQPGLGAILTGHASFDQVVQSLPWEKAFFYIGAGGPMPDPSRALSSERMQAFHQQVRDAFDVVIYDMPPVMGLADASLLSNHTDGVLLVVSFGKWGVAKALVETLERLKVARIPILGIAVNRYKGYRVDRYRR